jgi:hypothetical protein
LASGEQGRREQGRREQGRRFDDFFPKLKIYSLNAEQLNREVLNLDKAIDF